MVQGEPSGTRRILVRTENHHSNNSTIETDVLVVASKVKKYIKDRGDMSTGAAVMDVLTKHVIAACDRSIENARLAGRKTVLDRNVPTLNKR